MNEQIELGDEVKDAVTGFQGVVVGITTWLNGCRRMVVQPRTLEEKGRMPSSESIDETQLEVVTRRAVASQNRSDTPEPLGRTGGPRPKPQQHPTPDRW